MIKTFKLIKKLTLINPELIAKIIEQTQKNEQRGVNEMSKNNSVVPLARTALDRFKMEAAREVGVQSPIEENIHIL